MRYALMICRDENAWPGVPAVPAPEASSLAAGGACGVIGERPIPDDERRDLRSQAGRLAMAISLPRNVRPESPL